MPSSGLVTPRRHRNHLQLSRSSPSQQRQPEGSYASSPNGVPTSSPLFYHGSTPARNTSNVGDDDTTPRAAPSTVTGLATDSSPIRYSTSSPSRVTNAQQRESHSGSSGLFVASSLPAPPDSATRNRRGDINSDAGGASSHGRRLFVDERGNTVKTGAGPSDVTAFSNPDFQTCDANKMGGGYPTRVIWGTNISIVNSMHAMKDFLCNFETDCRLSQEGRQPLPDCTGTTKKYMQLLNTMLNLGVLALPLDARNLKSYPPTRKLWHQLRAFPNEIIPIMDVAVRDVMMELAKERMMQLRIQRQHSQRPQKTSHSCSMLPMPSSDNGPPAPSVADVPDLVGEVEAKTYRVRPFGLDQTINLRELNPADIDKLVSIKGLVIRTTPIIPDMKDAFFRCCVCNYTIRVDIDRGKIAEPTKCPRPTCSSPNSMQIVHNRSGFSDKQVIKLQETPDSVPDGQTPHSVSLCAYDELADVCKAGDRVEITGIFKCNQVRVNHRQRTVKNIFKTYIDVLHIQKVDKRRMGIDYSTIEEELSEHVAGEVEEVRKVSEEDEARIEEIAARPDVYELLARSLAPSIYEMDDVKKGILLQLFSGTNKAFVKGGSPKYRGDINILLCGDPSTSKSQLLQYVHKIAPRGIYTSGKGSSAVGLTAYVTRDPETRQLVLESGALVLSDGGVCCIDEFDKMTDATRSVLHEVMEQQTVSIAKAGIITTLNARTSILASANPIGSKYNPNLPVPQNIDLPPTLLSRFDLVYLVLDRIDEQNDRRLARHLVGMYLEDAPVNAAASEVLPVEFLTAYISHARARVKPRLTQVASDELVAEYVAMRKLGDDVLAAERRITATTRQLESMIRLAEAHAKMRLSSTVEPADVREAVRLIRSALKQAATDARTGLIDMALLTEGTSASDRRRKDDLKSAIQAAVDDLTRAGNAARLGDVNRRLSENAGACVDGHEVIEVLRALEAEGKVQVTGEGTRKSIRGCTGVL